MPQKITVAIVGAGNLGSALALSLKEAGYQVEAIVARKRRGSLARARQLAARLGACVVADGAELKSRVLWLCVPDTEIANTAASLAENFPATGRIALHSSGALTSDELHALKKKGAAVASVHPFMTFVKGPRPSLTGVPFAIEGDRTAVRIAWRIVSALGGEAYCIPKKDKPAYHAWGTFASPMLTALLVTTEEVAKSTGMSGDAARKRMLPILRRTVENYGTRGGAGGFSGPIIRGDVETVRRHLRVLGDMPMARGVYLSLARAAVAYLPAKNKKELQSLLEKT